MSNNPIPVIKFLFKDELKALSEALRLNPGYEVEEFNSATDLATYLSTLPAGLIICSLRTKEDLVQIASYIKIGKKVAKHCATKVVVINFSADKAFEKAIAKLGILDLVEPNVNTKALKFKLDFWMKSLTAQAKKAGTFDQKVVKASDTKQGSDQKQDHNIPNWTAPLELEDDIWLINKESEVKKILGKWLIRGIGPSPYIGQWVELKQGLWRFDIKESEKEMFTPNEGAWFFSGDHKPDFVWKENNWLFTGESFELFFKDSKQITSRFKSKDKFLTISKNSLYAKTKEQVIIESFDKELVFKKEAENLEDLEGKNKGETLTGSLEGKNKTDHLDHGNLSGETEAAAERKGNLRGKIEKQDSIDNEDLEKKADNSKEKTYWDGKNTYEEMGTADFGLKKEKEKSSGPLDAPVDGEHQKFYKNHNEAKQYEGAEKERPKREETESTRETPEAKERKPYEEASSSELDGKSHTDKIPDHLTNKREDSRSESPKTAREEKERKPYEESTPSDMSGKSHTDKIPAHFTNKKVDEEKEKARKEFEEIERLEKQHRENNREESTKAAPKDHSNPERERAEQSVKERPLREREEKEEFAAKERTHREREERGEFVSKEKAQRERSEREEFSAREKTQRERTERDDYSTPEKVRKERPEYEEEIEIPEALKGRSVTDKLSSHYGSRNSAKNMNENETGNPYETTNKSTRKSGDQESDHVDNVLPLHRERQEKAKEATQIALNEAGLEELTSDSRVTSYLEYKGKKLKCDFNDFFDDTIIFLAKEKDMEISSFINMDMSFDFLGREKKLSIDGSVMTVDPDGEGNHFVTIKLSQENIAAFDVFMKLYEKRQANVNEFIKRVKGF